MLVFLKCHLAIVGGDGDDFITADEINAENKVTVTIRYQRHKVGDIISGLGEDIILTEADITTKQISITVAARLGESLSVSVVLFCRRQSCQERQQRLLMPLLRMPTMSWLKTPVATMLTVLPVMAPSTLAAEADAVGTPRWWSKVDRSAGTSVLDEGKYADEQVRVRQTDKAGNTSADGQLPEITIDTTPLAKSAINQFDEEGQLVATPNLGTTGRALP